MPEKKKTGHCLCGAVHFSAQPVGHRVDACHCNMCQRWAGGPFLVLGCTAETTFAGSDESAVYPSSEWAERAFCKHCGSPLFYRLKNDGAYYIPVGLFDDVDGLVFDQEIFIDRKPALYAFANATRKLTEAETLALFAESGTASP